MLLVFALAIGTSYLLLEAPKRKYAICTFVPFVFALVTTFTAGVESIRMWWEKVDLESDPSQRFLLILACVLAGVLLALTVIITMDAMRHWYGVLRDGVPQRDEAVKSEAA